MPLSEKALISRIRGRAAHRGPNAVRLGIGDDSAVLRVTRGHEMLVTTDLNLEGVHFKREWHPPESVGHRCLARGLSDIAAMGGRPVAAFVSLAVPGSLAQSWVDGFSGGLLNLAKQFGLVLAGGDTARSPAGIFADVAVIGSVPSGKAILRSGAHPGDGIYVTGALGAAAATLDWLAAKRTKIRAGDFPQHFFPAPRVEIGRFLREKSLASAMIDISDGLSTDLAHLCEESGVGAEIQAEAVPLAVTGKERSVRVALRHALHGGDDYELLFTAPPGKTVPRHISGVSVTRIGRMVRGKRIILVDANGRRSKLAARGWQHFSCD
ncbi:MAG: thiamine-phosphate kinase [Acidobacteriales bacterium]|nr:thiamine-phosphate kinase [Terriglobales bacterium]